MKKKLLYIFTLALGISLHISGCTQKEEPAPVDTPYNLEIKYTIDGVETETVPNGQFYDVNSITGGKEVNAEWDVESWSLNVDEPKHSDVICTVDFTYTKSPFKMNNVGYASLQDALNAVTTDTPAVIDMTGSYNGYGITVVDTDVTLNLNGFTIDGMGSDTITNQGNLTIMGNGLLTNSITGEYTKTIVNYGTLTLKDLKITNSTDNVTVWNSFNGYSTINLYNCDVTHAVSASNVIINSGTMNLYGGLYHAASDVGYSVIKLNHSGAILNYYDGSIVNSKDGFTVTLVEGNVSNYSLHPIENGNNLGDSAKPQSATAEN